MQTPGPTDFRAKEFRYGSFFFTGLTGLATFLILALLALLFFSRKQRNQSIV